MAANEELAAMRDVVELAPEGAKAAPARTGPGLSLEIFPPKSEKAENNLWSALFRLKSLKPDFVSVTCGAGGSTRERTTAIAKTMQARIGVPAAAHLTCVGIGSQGELETILADYWEAGVRRILALRGDQPKDGVPVHAVYRNATELAAAIKAVAPFEVGVAFYPEIHPESPNLAHEFEVLKAKQAAGASAAYSQFFFEPETYLRFRDGADKAGVTLPLVPGILPPLDFKAAARMAKVCGASVPDTLLERYAAVEGDVLGTRLLSAAYVSDLCSVLKREGVETFHFYTLNQADLTQAIVSGLNLDGLREAA
jgi:methylenetetrahydrofolate reductase (NADPH)